MSTKVIEAMNEAECSEALLALTNDESVVYEVQFKGEFHHYYKSLFDAIEKGNTKVTRLIASQGIGCYMDDFEWSRWEERLTSVMLSDKSTVNYVDVYHAITKDVPGLGPFYYLAQALEEKPYLYVRIQNHLSPALKIVLENRWVACMLFQLVCGCQMVRLMATPLKALPVEIFQLLKWFFYLK